MPYYQSNKCELYYETTDLKSSEKVFVFLHGLGGSTEQTRSTFTDIPDNLGMVYVDLRGNGKSPIYDNRELSFETYAADVKTLCDLLGLSRIILGGISMGAGVSVCFALKYPEMTEKLILIRNAWLDKPMNSRNIAHNRAIYDFIVRYGAKKGKEMYMASPFYQNSVDRFPANEKSNLAAFDYEFAEETAYKYLCFPRSQPIKTMDDLSAIKCPVLILANRFDPPHPYQYGLEYHKHIYNSEFHPIPSKNKDSKKHFELINAYVRDFIEREEK